MTPTTAENHILTSRDICRLTGVSGKTVRRWAKSPDFPRPIQVGKHGRMRWPREAIMAYLEGRTPNVAA